jgi:hypothetical protein
MANRFVKPSEVIDSMMQSARREVDKIPLESCRSAYSPWPAEGRQFGIGIGGAIGVCFVLACMERVDREEFAGMNGAD